MSSENQESNQENQKAQSKQVRVEKQVVNSRIGYLIESGFEQKESNFIKGDIKVSRHEVDFAPEAFWKHDILKKRLGVISE